MKINSFNHMGLSPLQQSQFKNSMSKSSAQGILAALPAQKDYVLSPTLMNQINDSKAVNSQIVRAFEAKLREASGNSPSPEQDRVDYQSFVDGLLDEKLGYGPKPQGASATALADYTQEKIDSDQDLREFLDIQA